MILIIDLDKKICCKIICGGSTLEKVKKKIKENIQIGWIFGALISSYMLFILFGCQKNKGK